MSDKSSATAAPVIPGAITVEQVQKQKEQALKNAEAGKNDDSSEQNVVAAKATKGGRTASENILYVGNLAKSITEDALKQYFQVGGKVSSCKIIFDKTNEDVNYGFVEFFEKKDASIAFSNLNGQNIDGFDIKVNHAYQNTATATTQDETFNIFAGDLNIDVDDKILADTFSEQPGFVSAHVMWDMVTGFSRGYGFVSFETKEQADAALTAKQGFVLNGRPLRLNHAAKKQQQNQQRNNFNNNNNNNNTNNFNNNNNRPQHNNNGNNNNSRFRQTPLPPQALIPPPVDPSVVEDVIRSEPLNVSTAFIGNIPPHMPHEQLIMLLQNFGNIRDFKYFAEKRHCFVRYETREQAALCIVALGSGFQIRNRALRTGWGKDHPRPQQQQQQQMQGQFGGEPSQFPPQQGDFQQQPQGDFAQQQGQFVPQDAQFVPQDAQFAQQQQNQFAPQQQEQVPHQQE
ncbi:Nuclear and cytoplasmic polyadenylated RNA-binding protein PUB1 [Hanseniaspora osmophila]|uniref:Nuclear and cytoplasmic polyadenylated RNA-binding protein PUB1 n=1 Tax=Hanseniaspora osmophila TaxID=56408 RepID=A0A1E5RN13_9ASCO|nr:Nuclear and cytoplasmic polyadenylated RNA-binding protein PUB1 [Hanseniaspora osmophila]